MLSPNVANKNLKSLSCQICSVFVLFVVVVLKKNLILVFCSSAHPNKPLTL